MGCLRKHVHGFRRLWEGSRTHRQPESQSNSDGYSNKFAGTSRTLVSSDSILREQAVQSPCPETSPQSRNLAGSGTFASDISIADAASSRAIKTRAFTRRRPTRQRLAREDGFQHRRGRPRPQVDISTTAGPQVPQGRGRGDDAHGEPPRAAPALAPQARACAGAGAPAAQRARGAAQARADRVRRERRDAIAIVHAARGLAPRARRADRRVSEAAP